MSLVPFLSARGTIIAALKADTALIAVVPASRIWPSKTPPSPTWPFIRLDSLNAVPARYDCAEGSEITGTVHFFSKASATVLDPEAEAASVCDLIAAALEGIEECHVESAQVIPDAAEADAYHGIVRFRLSKV